MSLSDDTEHDDTEHDDTEHDDPEQDLLEFLRIGRQAVGVAYDEIRTAFEMTGEYAAEKVAIFNDLEKIREFYDKGMNSDTFIEECVEAMEFLKSNMENTLSNEEFLVSMNR